MRSAGDGERRHTREHRLADDGEAGEQSCTSSRAR
jgi:hypothetical protein